MKKVITTTTNKESLTTKLTLIVIGLTAGSALLFPATYASFHPVTTGEIADDTIRSADISNTAGVNSVDIVNGQVASVDIGTGQVASVDIRDGQVGSVDIGDGQVASADILDGTITSQDIASGTIPSGSTPDDNSVTSAKIADGEVKSVDIGNDEVFSVDIADGQVGSADIGDGQVASADIVDGQVGSVDIGTDAVTTDKISDTNGVHSVDIVDRQVGSVDIGDGQVSSVDIASGAVKLNVRNAVAGVQVPPNQVGTPQISCNSGETLVGGGFDADPVPVKVFKNRALGQNTWIVWALNDSNQTVKLEANAYCASLTP